MSKRGFEYGRMQNTTLYPTDLTDEQWNLLQLALPPRKTRKGRGRPPADLRRICSALLYFVRSGCAWRLLPRDFGPWKTIYHYFWLWTKQGCWKTLAAHGCYPGQSNRTLRRSSWRARLRCSQENQGDQTSYLGGYVGAAPLGLCYQSRCT